MWRQWKKKTKLLETKSCYRKLGKKQSLEDQETFPTGWELGYQVVYKQIEVVKLLQAFKISWKYYSI